MSAPRFCSLDFETRSTVDLRTAGVYKYAEHSTTDVWCVAYALDDGPVKLWYRGTPMPNDLSAAARNGTTYFKAWNAAFERIIWREIMVKRHGWPAIADDRFVCAMVVAASAGLPKSLEEAAIVLGLQEQKDMAGSRLMMQMARPRSIADDGTPIWWDDPAKLERLGAYCAQDVVVERELWKRLPPAMDRRERALYLLDQRINDRGVLLDHELIQAGKRVADRATKLLTKELSDLTHGTVSTPNKVEDLKRWIAMRVPGIDVACLDKDAIGDLLTLDLPADVRRALEIRAEAAKASVRKLASMEKVASSYDGRARGLLQYYGAGTGRWSGRLIQPQNFPRGEFAFPKDATDEEMNALWEGFISSIKFGTPPLPPMTAVSSALRGCIVADPGSALFVADFAAIEARVIAWLAGQDDLLALFASGGKVYETMAAVIYGIPVESVTKEQRQLGKMAVLGCFGPETKVLTERRSWVSIVDVRENDRVWDGESWVHHDGVVDRGERGVWAWNGITVTPDHLVWCGETFQSVEAVASDASTNLLRSAIDAVRTPWSGMSLVHAAASLPTSADATAGTRGEFIRPRGTEELPLDVGSVRVARPATLGSNTSGTPTSSRTINTGHAYSPESPRASHAATTPLTQPTRATGVVVSASTNRGARIVGRFSRIWSALMAGMSRSLNWIASTWTGGTNPVTCASSTGAPTSVIDDRLVRCNVASINSKPILRVYDLANCGPHNRFLIRTEAGPLLVHNCGFQMGAKRFAEQAGVDLELAEQAVAAYRTRNARIKALWWAMQDTAIRVVSRGATQPVAVPGTGGKLHFRIVGNWLAMGLPSGRSLWYYAPRIVMKPVPWSDELVPAVEIDAMNGYTRKWEPAIMYGGLWAENATQAVARDLMADGMMRLESAGFPVLLTVHDEVIAQADPAREVGDFVSTLAAVPVWAAGCPVAAEGWMGLRYKK